MAPSDDPLSSYLGLLPAQAEARVLRLLIDLGRRVVGADEGSLLVYDAERRVLVFAMTLGSEEAEAEARLKGQVVPLGEGRTGMAAEFRTVQVGAPAFHDIEFQQHKERGGSEPDIVLAAPMIWDDTLVGVITAVSFDSEKRFTQDDATVYEEFAGIAAFVVAQWQRLQLHEAASAVPDSLPADSSARAELELLQRVHRLVRRGPDTLRQVNSLLDAVEKMVGE